MHATAQTNLASWQELAERYEAIFASERRYDASYEAFGALLPTGGRVLEAGCGPAFLLRYLAARRPDLPLHAADGAPAMLALVRQRLPQAGVHLCDLSQPEQLPAGPWQALALPFCISYLPEAANYALLQAVWQQLAPGGFLYLSFTAGRPQRSGEVRGSTGHAMHFYFYHASTLKVWLRKQGWGLLFEERLRYYRRRQSETQVLWVWQKPVC